MTRGLRNNNPGNIRLGGSRFRGEENGTDPAFKTFEAPEWGVRAIFVVLNTYRVRHGLTTIAAMIERWAPAVENDTAAYVSLVSAWSGVSASQELDTRSAAVMIPIVAAMIRMENGTPLAPDIIEKGWNLFIAK